MINVIDVFLRVLDLIAPIVVGGALIVAVIAWHKVNRAQTRINTSFQQSLDSQSARIGTLFARVDHLSRRPPVDDPRVRPDLADDRWGQMDKAVHQYKIDPNGTLERLRLEIDNIETEHRENRDHDKHEPGS